MSKPPSDRSQPAPPARLSRAKQFLDVPITFTGDQDVSPEDDDSWDASRATQDAYYRQWKRNTTRNAREVRRMLALLEREFNKNSRCGDYDREFLVFPLLEAASEFAVKQVEAQYVTVKTVTDYLRAVEKIAQDMRVVLSAATNLPFGPEVPLAHYSGPRPWAMATGRKDREDDASRERDNPKD
jgi:hypothetical protein